jgi:AraC family transcriptional regulator of adaptative response / DNA-3-methyladenine glycosylase II
LRRLFLRHLGASPIAVAHTRRLHFAKKLIDETRLPLGQIALASGFGCVRRFNAAIRKTYKRTPTQIRRLAKQAPAPLDNHSVFRLRFRPPYHWPTMLAFLKARAIPGVEAVVSGSYFRSIFVDGIAGHLEVSFEEELNSLRVRIQFSEPRSLFFIMERVRTMFDLNADTSDIARAFKNDSDLARRVERAPGMRVPGCWNGFELATRAILGQQITVRAATTLAGRIVQKFGKTFPGSSAITHLFPTPETLADADLSSIGLTRARSHSIRALARAVCDGRLRFEGIVEFQAFLEQFMELPGIGPWTAQYVAMRALGEPDAFPPGDAALLSALRLTNASELERRAEAWRPWRAYAAMYLWNVPGSEIRKPKSQLSRLSSTAEASASIFVAG